MQKFQVNITRKKQTKMSKINVGDRISVLDDDFEGIVISIKNERATIETSDGFEMEYHISELISMSNQSFNLKANVGNVQLAKKEKEIEKPRSFVKEKKSKNDIGVPEFDLHIEKLVKSFKGMNNYDIMTLQIETAQRHIEFAIKNRIPKIVFIHGVGEGILKAELDFMLGRYDQIVFQDANYQKYGLGATEVYFKQN